MTYLNGKMTLGDLSRMRDRLHSAQQIARKHMPAHPPLPSWGRTPAEELAEAVGLVAAVLQEIVAGASTDVSGRSWIRRE